MRLREMTDNSPLTGLKIAITRPREQAVQLAQRIGQAGGNPLLFPLLDISAVQDTQTLHEQVSRLAQFDLAVFISPNAVQYGIAAIRAAGNLPCPPQNVGGESSSSGGADGRQLPQSAGFASNVLQPPFRVQGARRATTETYFWSRRGSENRATQRADGWMRSSREPTGLPLAGESNRAVGSITSCHPCRPFRRHPCRLQQACLPAVQPPCMQWSASSRR